MNIMKHIFQQPFIFATGLAALIHSTWSLGTVFAGSQPENVLTIEGVGWLLPALLIAFALDIGQIATSAEIRAGQRTRAKYATFMIFAAATYYLQWLYIAHHMPALPLADGVRADWAHHITVLRDLAVWIVPGLLPLSTALYTISQQENDNPPAVEINVKPIPIRYQQIEDSFVQLPDAIEDDETDTEPYEPIQADNANDYVNLTCVHCGWETGPRLRRESAERSLRTHQARYCDAYEVEVE